MVLGSLESLARYQLVCFPTFSLSGSAVAINGARSDFKN